MRIGLVSKKLLAVDWDARNLRLVSVRPRADGVDLLKAVSIPVPSEVKMDDAEALGALIRAAMSQSRISVKQAVLSIPREQVVLNTLDLPPTPPEEMPALVQFQIVKELPFAPDQATLDFAVGPAFDPKEPNRVLVAAVRNEAVSFYRRVAYEAGLSVERLGLRPHANLVAVTGTTPEAKDKTVLLIEVGPQLTEVDIIQGGTLVFSRAASVAVPEQVAENRVQVQDSRISSAELHDREPDEVGRQAVSGLMVEIIRSFEAHRATDPGITIDQVVVCGALGIEPYLAQSLAARFATQAHLYSPERALGLPPQRAKELRGFSAALGLAMGHSQKGLSTFDFLHPKRPVSKRTIRLKKIPVAVITALLFVASGITSYAKLVLPKKEQLQALEDRIEPKRKQAKDIREFQEKVMALENWEKSEQYWPEVLVSLTENFPGDQQVCVTRMDLETRSKARAVLRESRMALRLRTAALGNVHEVSAKLRELGYPEVKAGKETPISGRREAGVYHYDTDIEAQLPPRPQPSAKSEGVRNELREQTGPEPEEQAGETPDEQVGEEPEAQVGEEPEAQVGEKPGEQAAEEAGEQVENASPEETPQEAAQPAAELNEPPTSQPEPPGPEEEAPPVDAAGDEP